mmetsp:Transcript_74528/g.197971  ORF Transcript_74528/g.197971 Transcript_74528/m.197971 type:complete len:316 (-) Transcript_74528:92-1039(-)
MIAAFCCVVVLLLAHPVRSLLIANTSCSGHASPGSILPAYWLHIPKTGSNFATTIVHTTCGDSIKPNKSFMSPRSFFRHYGRRCPEDKFLRFQSGHVPLEQGRPEILSHVVVMAREPRQRIISGYYAFPQALHSCRRLQKAYHCKRGGQCDGALEKEGRYMPNPDVIPPRDYGECVENCLANMLTGADCGSATPPNVSLAIANLKELGFVGLTGQWELSVCLWHARFGGTALEVELPQKHIGTMTLKGGYDVEGLLGDWRPKNDVAVYEAAEERFYAELKSWNVTAEACDRWLVSVGAKRNTKGNNMPPPVYDED